MTDVPRGRVIFRTIEDRPLVVRCWMGPQPPKVSGGYGGWQEVDRPKRMSVTEWRGAKPHRMSVDILMDGYHDDDPVEEAISRLENMGRNPGGDEAPPRLNVETTGARPRTPNVEWVINDIAWGDAIYNTDGLRVRQAAVVDLLQFIDDEGIKTLKRRHRKKGKKKGKRGARRKGILVKPRSSSIAGLPETLMHIAARELGDATRWHEIAELNGIRDPNNLKIDQMIKLP